MPAIYTAGYARLREPERLLALARQYDAQVIDVRLKPYTSFRGWSRRELQDSLGDRYRWVEWFGNVNYGGGPPRLRDAAYGTRLVAPLLAEQSVILLCGCADPRQCHRSLVADVLAAATGCPVHHLDAGTDTPDDSAPGSPQQLTLF